MGMPPGSIRRSANLVLLFMVAIGALGAMLIVVGLLGAFLLPLTFVFFWLLIVYAIGDRMSGVVALGGIIVLFLFGYSAHLFLGSIIGYDFVESSYVSGLATVKLATVGYSISDSTFSTVLGFGAILIVVLLAFGGLFLQAKRRR